MNFEKNPFRNTPSSYWRNNSYLEAMCWTAARDWSSWSHNNNEKEEIGKEDELTLVFESDLDIDSAVQEVVNAIKGTAEGEALTKQPRQGN